MLNPTFAASASSAEWRDRTATVSDRTAQSSQPSAVFSQVAEPMATHEEPVAIAPSTMHPDFAWLWEFGVMG